VSLYLNEYENHRTPTEYENSLIVKTFLFKFVNSYNSLFYIAFFKQYDASVGYCLNGDCLGELQAQLATIFILNFIVNNSLQIVVPMLDEWWTAKSNAAFDKDGKEKVKTVAENEYDLDLFESTFEDFDLIAIQYGYVCLFVVAFPLAPLLALINNFFFIRLAAKKIVTFCRRPEPSGAENIGTWCDILQILSFIAVVTNTLLCVFYTKIIDDAAEGQLSTKIWIFVIAEHLIMAIKLCLMYMIDDVPLDIKQHIARQEYLVDVLINGREEDPEDDSELSLKKLNAEAHKFGHFHWADVPLHPTQEVEHFMNVHQ